MHAQGKGFLLLFAVFLLTIACKKQDSPYFLTITTEVSDVGSWESDRIDGVILNDSLLIVATQKNGSGVSIIVNGANEGEYDIVLNNLEALVTFDQTGEKDPAKTYISAAGQLVIVEKNSSNRTIKGFFNVTAVDGMLSNQVNLQGEFATKYKQ
jgi:hypothetical protein